MHCDFVHANHKKYTHVSKRIHVDGLYINISYNYHTDPA
jgi:hypothetical protein